MQNFFPVSFEIISDQSAMTAPPNGFGAENRGSLFSRDGLQTFDAFLKWSGHHVIGIAAKSFIAPRRVGRIRTRFAPSAKFWKMKVLNAIVFE